MKKKVESQVQDVDNFYLQKEVQDIFTHLVKDNSVNSTSEEILSKCVNLSKSTWGILYFPDEKKHSNFFINNEKLFLNNVDELKQEIQFSYNFISKWLTANQKPLVIFKDDTGIGYNLVIGSKSSSVVVTPGFFENELIAIIITGKDSGGYCPNEINNLEQLALILSFSIKSIKTKELNAALESRLLQAQKLETIGKLSSGIAHDFNNLLSSIFGSLNLLKKRVEQREDILRFLDNIENCSIRAKDLTKGLLSFGKPTPKRQEKIRPNALMNELSKIIIQTFPKKIDVEFCIEPGLSDILGNETEIYQVLLNLCVNAKEAIENKGSIKIKAENIQIDNKLVFENPLLNVGNYVKFSVEDSGEGIKEENLQKIFDPYFSTKEKETGSGLGLYVSYGIVKAHKGYIDVTSSENGGTIFNVYIPTLESIEKDKEYVANKIVLLADDELMLRDLLAELLESNDYAVIKVSTGDEALKVLREEIKVDLVIIDYNMPGMNGIETISKIKELELNMPIILSTGSLSFTGDVDLNKIGVNSILTKPYEFETMLATIKNFT